MHWYLFDVNAAGEGASIITKRVDVQVYDVTGWTAQHPGGRVIATYAGRDATDVFACFHAATSWGQLKQFYIGDLVVSYNQHSKSHSFVLAQQSMNDSCTG